MDNRLDSASGAKGRDIGRLIDGNRRRFGRIRVHEDRGPDRGSMPMMATRVETLAERGSLKPVIEMSSGDVHGRIRSASGAFVETVHLGMNVEV